MFETYLEYCFADRYFYDAPLGDVVGDRNVNTYRVAADVDWSGWDSGTKEAWRYLTPVSATVPGQGWKVHVSATAKNAQEILTAVSAYCHREGIPFKHLPTSSELFRMNMKYAARGSSGKFITIYPASDARCERVVRDLDREVGGADGPYILSDLRWLDGPVHVRYGGFVYQEVRDDRQQLVPAIQAPDGTLVPDERGPVFRPPSWVEPPDFVREQIARLGGSQRPESFPYEIHEALHFSNGGGVYKARNVRDGRTVVLKEGRPFAGLTADGRDAVDRLKREAEFLRELTDVPAAVRYEDYLVEAGHHFLVEEYIDGRTLGEAAALRNALGDARRTREDRREYRDWAMTVLAAVTGAVEQLHERGIVFGDLHPRNLLLTADDEPRFIDFEMAYRIDETDVVPAGAPGFVAPDGRTGPAADLYALAAMRLSLFMPLTMLHPLDSGKLEGLVVAAQELFELDDEFCASIVRETAVQIPRRAPSPLARRTYELARHWRTRDGHDVTNLARAITRGVWESVDLSRQDRAFPGDIRQFEDNPYGIAHGACGNLLATPGTAEAQAEAFAWVRDGIASRPVAPGFYDGAAGIAYTARRLGQDDVADEIVAGLVSGPLEGIGSAMYGGLAGIGCFLLEEQGRSASRDVSEALTTVRDVLADRMTRGTPHVTLDDDGVPMTEIDKGGLMHGWSGQSLFWIRSFEATGDPRDLERAREALDVDLRLCLTTPDGTIQLNEGARVMPYLATGSAGVGLVLLKLAGHIEIPGWRDTLAGIERASNPAFTILPNLFKGRAGLAYFADRVLRSGQASFLTRDDFERHIRSLGLYAVVHRTGIHFPGEQLLRLSTDWATGSAGVNSVLSLAADGADDACTARMPVPVLGLDPLYRPHTDWCEPNAACAPAAVSTLP